jgi:hypothetical protein
MQPLVDATTYRRIVESLRYLVNTHLNLIFAVGYVSRFLEEPRKDHLATLKWVLCYVVGTSDWGLWFGQKKGNQALLTGFNNANFAIDVDLRKNTKVIFFLVNSTVT